MSNLVHDRVSSTTAESDQQDRGMAVTPRVDVVETDNEFLVFADMPGTKPEEVDIRFEQGELTVHGRRSSRRDDFAAYHRVFSIADTVAADRISADLRAGVLTIHLPKVEAVKPKRITVNG
jgi:HSP20 family protein